MWANLLDAVIGLGAPDDVLRQRVNSLPQEHVVKGTPEAEATASMARYQDPFDRVLAAIEQPGGPMILRYDTSRQDRVDVASNTIEELSRVRPEPGHPASEGGPP